MIYKKQIEDIGWQDIIEFCEQQLPESAYLDYKEDFPTNLHKTIAAFANTLGGIILIGVEEDDQNKPVLPLKGIRFQRGLSERVTNIILSNITPPLFPEIQICLNSDQSQAIVLLRVHPSENPPHAISDNAQVYLRTANRNKPESLADLDQIQWLLNKRRKPEQLREQIYGEADIRFRRLYDRQLTGPTTLESYQSKGLFTLSLCPLYPRDYFCIPPELSQISSKIFVRDYFKSSDKFPITRHRIGEIVQNGIVLSFLDKNMVFYTELNSFGLYFYRQILQRRYVSGHQERKIMLAIEIYTRLDEFIDSSIRFYGEIGYSGPLKFIMKLENILNYPFGPYPEQDLLYSLEDKIQFSDNVIVGALGDRKFEIIYAVAQRLAWAFGLDISEELLKNFYTEYKK